MTIKKILLTAIGYVILVCACKTNYPTDINATDFKNKITTEQNIQILDVRTLEEFKNQHLANALNIDWQNKAEFNQEIKKIDPQKSTYVYCKSGVRSGEAANYLLKKGFTKVYTLQGGLNNY